MVERVTNATFDKFILRSFDVFKDNSSNISDVSIFGVVKDTNNKEYASTYQKNYGTTFDLLYAANSEYTDGSLVYGSSSTEIKDVNNLKNGKNYLVPYKIDSFSEYSEKSEHDQDYYISFQYTPESGEGVGKICKKYGMTTAEFYRYNNIDPDDKNPTIKTDHQYTIVTRVDEEFIKNYYNIPDEDVFDDGSFMHNGIRYEPGEDYTVVKGDKLGDIAKKYGCDIEAIVKANPDKNFGEKRDRLIENDVIKLPQLYVQEEHNTYIAQDGTQFKVDFPPYLKREEYSKYFSEVQELLYWNSGKLPDEPHKNFSPIENIHIMLNNNGGDKYNMYEYHTTKPQLKLSFTQMGNETVYTKEQIAEFLGCSPEELDYKSEVNKNNKNLTYYDVIIDQSSLPKFAGTEAHVSTKPYELSQHVQTNYKYPDNQIEIPDYVNPNDANAVKNYENQVLVLSYINSGKMPENYYSSQEQLDEALAKIKNGDILDSLVSLGSHGFSHEIANVYIAMNNGDLAVYNKNTAGDKYYLYTPENGSNLPYDEFLKLIGCNPEKGINAGKILDLGYEDLPGIKKMFSFLNDNWKPFARKENMNIFIDAEYATRNVAGVGRWYDDEYYRCVIPWNGK